MKTNTMKNWPYPTLFAHRGGGVSAPENTLAAIKMGHAQSYIAVEFDVKLSQDGVALLMHDATLERTTDGSGFVAEKVSRSWKLTTPARGTARNTGASVFHA